MSTIDFEKMRRQMMQERRAQRDVAPVGSVVAAAPEAYLDEQHRLGPASRTGKLPVVHYISDWLSRAEAEELETSLPSQSDPAWSDLGQRRLLNCGGVPHPSGMIEEEMPAWFDPLQQKLTETGAFPDGQPPNQALLNEYTSTAESDGGGGIGGACAGSGGIAPHNDGPIFEARVAIVSLGTPAVLHFWPVPKNDAGVSVGSGWRAISGDVEPACSVLLQPRSLLVFSAEAYTHMLHGIRPASTDVLGPTVCNLGMCHSPAGLAVGEVIERGRRLSLTVRRVVKVAKQLGAFLTTEDEAERLRRWHWWRGAISEER